MEKKLKMTKLLYVSDLHLEFSEFPISDNNSGNEIAVNSDDILLVAGDTVIACALQKHRTDGKAKQMKKRFDRFLEIVSGFKEVIMIGGNHEAYSGGNVAKNQQWVNEYIVEKGYTNIRMVENEHIVLNDKYDLLACTLWTSMGGQFEANPSIAMQVSGLMNDFYPGNCFYDGGQFTTDKAAELHFTSKRWMQFELMKNPKLKSFIIMTHHLPSFQGIDPAYKGDVMNFGYASSMEDLIYSNPQIKYWIHGHTHYNTDFMIDNCRVLSHQRGYPNQFTFDRTSNWLGFKTIKWIEI